MASTDDSTPRLLPKDYRPGQRTVIIGRGKKTLNHEGNKWFRMIVKGELQAYQESRKKSDKSILLLGIVRRIRTSNEDGVGFVKQDLTGGRWYEISENASRVTVAQAFRDALSRYYKSSKQSKQHKRKLEKQRCEQLELNDEVSTTSSEPSTKSGGSKGLSINDAIAVARMKNQAFAENGMWKPPQSFGGRNCSPPGTGGMVRLPSGLPTMDQGMQDMRVMCNNFRVSPPWNMPMQGYPTALQTQTLPTMPCPSYPMKYPLQCSFQRPQQAFYLNCQGHDQQMGPQNTSDGVSSCNQEIWPQTSNADHLDPSMSNHSLQDILALEDDEIFDFPLPDLKAAFTA